MKALSPVALLAVGAVVVSGCTHRQYLTSPPGGSETIVVHGDSTALMEVSLVDGRRFWASRFAVEGDRVSWDRLGLPERQVVPVDSVLRVGRLSRPRGFTEGLWQGFAGGAGVGLLIAGGAAWPGLLVIAPVALGGIGGGAGMIAGWIRGHRDVLLPPSDSVAATRRSRGSP